MSFICRVPFTFMFQRRAAVATVDSCPSAPRMPSNHSMRHCVPWWCAQRLVTMPCVVYVHVAPTFLGLVLDPSAKAPCTPMTYSAEPAHMNMRRHALIVLMLGTASSCISTVQQRWSTYVCYIKTEHTIVCVQPRSRDLPTQARLAASPRWTSASATHPLSRITGSTSQPLSTMQHQRTGRPSNSSRPGASSARGQAPEASWRRTCIRLSAGAGAWSGWAAVHTIGPSPCRMRAAASPMARVVAFCGASQSLRRHVAWMPRISESSISKWIRLCLRNYIHTNPAPCAPVHERALLATFPARRLWRRELYGAWSALASAPEAMLWE